MAEPTKTSTLGARINRALGGLLLLQNAPGVDTTRDTVSQGKGGHGKHGTTSIAPSDFQPLAIEWADFFRRAADMAELDLAMERGEVPRPTLAKPGRVADGVARQRRQRIARSAIYQGRRPEFVAYVEGVSVTLVREARERARLDPLTGLPVEKPLTAPPPRA